MNAAFKLPALGLGAAVLTAAGALPYYSSQTLDKRLSEFASQATPQSDVLLRNLQHRAGYLS